jgi:hypothetical protein
MALPISLYDERLLPALTNGRVKMKIIGEALEAGVFSYRKISYTLWDIFIL